MSSRRREGESSATCNNGRIYKLSSTNLSLRGSISPFITNCSAPTSRPLTSPPTCSPVPSPPTSSTSSSSPSSNLSSNQLSGPILPQLILCAYLNVINLHDNSFTCPIPQQLGLLVRLSASPPTITRIPVDWQSSPTLNILEIFWSMIRTPAFSNSTNNFSGFVAN
ncbi:hypothetical protein FF1_034209 [Malus domestica]